MLPGYHQFICNKEKISIQNDLIKQTEATQSTQLTLLGRQGKGQRNLKLFVIQYHQ
jgi:hypothetical protein